MVPPRAPSFGSRTGNNFAAQERGLARRDMLLNVDWPAYLQAGSLPAVARIKKSATAAKIPATTSTKKPMK